MTQEHPITPPPKLAMKWWDEGPEGDEVALAEYMATQAARWGADQELEECCQWLIEQGWFGSSNHEAIVDLRAARRKPPSLKEQALALINGCTDPHGDHLDDAALDTIRRALETLDD